jgi:hypothetical protein
LRRKLDFLTGEDGGEAKTYDSEKAWSSINQEILSARALLATEGGRKDPQLAFKANIE